MRVNANKALHRTTISLFSIATDELNHWVNATFLHTAFEVQIMEDFCYDISNA